MSRVSEAVKLWRKNTKRRIQRMSYQEDSNTHDDEEHPHDGDVLKLGTDEHTDGNVVHYHSDCH